MVPKLLADLDTGLEDVVLTSASPSRESLQRDVTGLEDVVLTSASPSRESLQRDVVQPKTCELQLTYVCNVVLCANQVSNFGRQPLQICEFRFGKIHRDLH